MNKKVMAAILSFIVGLTAMHAFSYGPVIADRIEEVTGEDAGGTYPQDEAVTEEMIDEDYDASGIAVNETNFPDANFRRAVLDRADTNSNGVLSAGEISAFTQIGWAAWDIRSFKGIQFFTALETIYYYDYWSDNDSLGNELYINVSSLNNLVSLWLINSEDQSSRGSTVIILNPVLSSVYNEAVPRSYGDEPYHLIYENANGSLLIPRNATVLTYDQYVSTVNMYRLYNPNSGEHFYTSSNGERDHLISLGWNYEGIGWAAPAYSDTPVYRLYNRNGGEHHYTTSIAERNMLINAGWNDEGIGWYSDDQRRVPLYRQYNPNAFANNHNYTTSQSENNWLVSLGWRAEGIGWYGTGTGR